MKSIWVRVQSYRGARAQPRSKSWGVQKIFFRPREGEEREGTQIQNGTQIFFFVLSYIYSNCRNQQKMHCFYKRYKSSRQYSRHVLKVDNYFTPESRFNMIIRALEAVIYDCPKFTSNGPPKTDPPGKTRSQKLGGGHSGSWGSGPPDPPSGCALATQ